MTLLDIILLTVVHASLAPTTIFSHFTFRHDACF